MPSAKVIRGSRGVIIRRNRAHNASAVSHFARANRIATRNWGVCFPKDVAVVVL